MARAPRAQRFVCAWCRRPAEPGADAAPAVENYGMCTACLLERLQALDRRGPRRRGRPRLAFPLPERPTALGEVRQRARGVGASPETASPSP